MFSEQRPLCFIRRGQTSGVGFECKRELQSRLFPKGPFHEVFKAVFPFEIDLFLLVRQAVARKGGGGGVGKQETGMHGCLDGANWRTLELVGEGTLHV